MRRPRSWTRWFATALPQPLAAAPERVIVNVACIVIGIGSLITERPGSLLELWPSWVAAEWALVMTLGGAAALTGYWQRQTSQRALWLSLERVGYLAILLATVLYGVGVIAVFGWQGAIGGLLYLAIAFAKAVRLAVSTRAREEILRPARDDGDPA